MTKLFARLEKLKELRERDLEIKKNQDRLNEDINKFFNEELEFKGPATLLDISMRLLETSYEPTITPSA